MPEQIECDSCGALLFALGPRDPEPVGRDGCPNCDGTDFSFLD
ncbi:hypothetical protein ACFQMA_05870 [Halosimplex aquaticum]|uniref:Small CPxCG-related zinc finger protein n=1 Tax=Halosimplex aquaticum TaxID=3026162 RepID=A0ABD5XWD8_9EURY|nr:hypothetical protein [Halosimplex aquaticum]